MRRMGLLMQVLAGLYISRGQQLLKRRRVFGNLLQRLLQRLKAHSETMWKMPEGIA